MTQRRFLINSLALILILAAGCARSIDPSKQYFPSDSSQEPVSPLLAEKGDLKGPGVAGETVDMGPDFALSSPFDRVQCQHPLKVQVASQTLNLTEEVEADKLAFVSFIGETSGYVDCTFNPNLFIHRIYACEDQVVRSGGKIEVDVVIGVSIADPYGINPLMPYTDAKQTLYFEGIMTLTHLLPKASLLAGKAPGLVQVNSDREPADFEDPLYLSFFSFSDVKNSFVINLIENTLLHGGHVQIATAPRPKQGPAVHQQYFLNDPQNTQCTGH
jgi:hypothetical protein